MKILSVLFAFTVLLSIGCKNAPERPDAILDENYEPIVPSNTPPPAAATAEPAQNAQGVWHYTCSNGCAGGGGSATACSTCGSTLVHNSAYHAAAGGTPTVPTTAAPPMGGSQIGSITNPVVNGTNPTATAPPVAAAPPSTPEPAQNAQGVWHYICNNGCAGGGGSAVACAGCGSTLAHNSAYHN